MIGYVTFWAKSFACVSYCYLRSSSNASKQQTRHHQQFSGAAANPMASYGDAGVGAETKRGGKPTNEQIRRFSLQQLRDEVVLPKTNKNRRSTLDGGDLTPEDCLSYMRAVIDRVAALQAEGAGRAASESEQKIVQEIKDAISAQIDVMNSSNVSEQLNADKKELWKYVRKSIPTPKAGQIPGKLPAWSDFPSSAGEATHDVMLAFIWAPHTH